MEGRLQEAHKAVPTPGQALQDWVILRDLMGHLESCHPGVTAVQAQLGNEGSSGIHLQERMAWKWIPAQGSHPRKAWAHLRPA
jgi:hypothetical protein